MARKGPVCTRHASSGAYIKRALPGFVPAAPAFSDLTSFQFPSPEPEIPLPGVGVVYVSIGRTRNHYLWQTGANPPVVTSVTGYDTAVMNGTKLRRLFLCRVEFIRPVAVGGYPHCGYSRVDRWNGNVVGRMNSTNYNGLNRLNLAPFTAVITNTSDNHPHMVIYASSCITNWFDINTGACH